MSILTNKSALLIGEENFQFNNLMESLEAHGARVEKISDKKISQAVLDEIHPDIVLYNNLHESAEREVTLEIVRDYAARETVPVFTLIEDTPEAIRNILSLGVTDYITPHDDVRVVLSKIKATFGEEDLFSSSTVIDITPTKAHVTTTGIRVFVIEDDPLLRNLLSMKLERSNFPSEFSTDGANVLPQMYQFNPDVIILDLMLPGRSGFEVLTEIKNDKKLSDVPVVVFSNRDGQEDRQKASELGAKGFYVKAMTDLSELIETIESLTK